MNVVDVNGTSVPLSATKGFQKIGGASRADQKETESQRKRRFRGVVSRLKGINTENNDEKDRTANEHERNYRGEG